MKELGVGTEETMMEYIITMTDGKQVRMLLGADEFNSIQKVIKVMSKSNEFESICAYSIKNIKEV